MNDTERVAPGCLFVVLAGFIVLATLALGCGNTPAQSARHVVSAAGIALDVADIASAQAYTARAHEALTAAATLADYHAAMAPFDALERALRTLAAALHVADALVTVWEHSGVQPVDWPQGLACVVGGLEGVREVMTAAGVDLPVELTSALDLVSGIVSPDACTAAPEASP